MLTLGLRPFDWWLHKSKWLQLFLGFPGGDGVLVARERLEAKGSVDFEGRPLTRNSESCSSGAWRVVYTSTRVQSILAPHCSDCALLCSSSTRSTLLCASPAVILTRIPLGVARDGVSWGVSFLSRGVCLPRRMFSSISSVQRRRSCRDLIPIRHCC